MSSAWLSGRSALVVGGGSGIGRAVVDAYLEEGARVTVLERDETKCAALERDRPDVRVVRGDATTAPANAEAVSAAVATHGRLDIVVSCVGVFDFYRGLDDLDVEVLDEAFAEVFGVNVRSYLHTVKAAIPELRRSHGCVVLTESTSSYYPGRGGVLYVASKFAVRGLVAALAAELAPDVRVNAVAPGGTLHTDLRGPRSLGEEGRVLGASPGRHDELVARTPLAVALTGEDHAGSYVFLASERARGITGGVLHSDGGIAVKT